MSKFPDSTAAMRIAAVIQSIFQLILPAIVTALIVTRRPATFLAVDRQINLPIVFLAFAGLLAATPAMNLIIHLNQSLSLPESLSGLENALRTMEDNAAKSISLLQGSHTVGNLLMNILIIGVLAGFGEELFFRGTFMRLMTTGRINPHVAIWTVAIVFSAMHLQFFGFVPRTLLGAYFGYLLYWSRSLWIPIIIHAANNIMYICCQWAYGTTGDETTPVDTIGTDGNWVAVIISIILTTGIIYVIKRRRITD
ncbi:MAG: CPBP family intramembrane metalloprotease [Muribaculaceae bacterium]|nr:CPBP family intramembrane metalloprotease [Muribaculaceae bacterium]